MRKYEEAIIYATIMHQNKVRPVLGTPAILHVLEVAQILTTMSEDLELIAAGVLHDVVTDTCGSIEEIRERFGERVASLVASNSVRIMVLNPDDAWKNGIENTLKVLSGTNDLGIRMLRLADMLANLRSVSNKFSARGEKMWADFGEGSKAHYLWYYQKAAEILELDLNKTGAFKELIQLINHIWPGTFPSEKAKYKEYKSYSVEGCPVIGRGAKGTVYRYDDELVIKVYNDRNMFKEIERENYLARRAFIAGIPTAISFGIVTVGDRYGSIFELLHSSSVMGILSKDNSKAEYCAELMADLALCVHGKTAENIDLPNYKNALYDWVYSGVRYEDFEITSRLTELIDALPDTNTMIHGDFHMGNVMIENGEPLLIDMDELSVCHPIAELSGLYQSYISFGEISREMLESFNGFSVEVAKKFFHAFMARYLGTDDENRIQEVVDKAAVLAYARLVRRAYKHGRDLTPENAAMRDLAMAKLREILPRVDSLTF